MFIKNYGASSPVRATAAPFTADALLIQLPGRAGVAANTSAPQPARRPATAGHVCRPLGGYERGPPGM